MANYEFRACSLRTGRVLANLPLVSVTAEKRLDQGRFSGSLWLPSALPNSPDRDERLGQCRVSLSNTTPATTSILVLRDGNIMGEWIIWTRDRTQRPVPLTGLEFKSWFDHSVVDGFPTYTNIDQLQLAYQLALHAASKPLAPLMTVENPGTSGNVVPKAEYPTGSEYVGKILEDLSDDLNGFDWWIDTTWDTTQDLPTVKRTVRFQNPRRGRTLQARIDVPAQTPGQSGVAFGLTEDGTRVATTVYMTGTGEGETQLVSRGTNNDLLQSYPPLDYIDSRSSYDVQVLLDAQAQAVAAAARTPELPTTVRVRADGDMQLGTYEPGDFLPLVVEPYELFPDGYRNTIRVLGFTMSPPDGGRTEMVDVEIQSGDASGFDP